MILTLKEARLVLYDPYCDRGCYPRDLCYAEEYDYPVWEPTVEEMCEQYSQHEYDGEDSDGGRCFCGKTRYPKGGPSAETQP